MGVFKRITDKVTSLASSAVKEMMPDKVSKLVSNTVTTVKETTSTNMSKDDDDKVSQMMKILDWAYDKSNGNVPGFGSSQEVAAKYLEKNDGNVGEAVDSMVRWQIASAATAGFVTSLGGLPTMVVSLPANIAGVIAIQLRMIGAIAHMTGEHEMTEERKTAVYLCLLGAEAGNFFSKAASQFTTKLALASLKKLPGAALVKINQAIGFRLVTKFGTKGIFNLHKAIPILGGVVGGSVDAISTLSIAKTAKKLFLGDIIDFEKQEQLEMARMQVLINMALVDGVYSKEEGDLLKVIASTLDISEKCKQELNEIIDHPKRLDVDLSPFQEDPMVSACLLGTLKDILDADGNASSAEKIYFNTLAANLGYEKETLKELFN